MSQVAVCHQQPIAFLDSAVIFPFSLKFTRQNEAGGKTKLKHLHGQIQNFVFSSNVSLLKVQSKHNLCILVKMCSHVNGLLVKLKDQDIVVHS